MRPAGLLRDQAVLVVVGEQVPRPSMSRLICEPSIQAICWEGSATKSNRRLRHSSVCRCMASGSFGEITTRSRPPARSAIGCSSIWRASAIAPV